MRPREFAKKRLRFPSGLLVTAALAVAATPASAWAPSSHEDMTRLIAGRLALALPAQITILSLAAGL